ncbi:dimethylhistidine N-methyltransferase [Comamonas phosphati]|nr:dimethylhistidine N-methyltransferase [Comamonas phosphati]
MDGVSMPENQFPRAGRLPLPLPSGRFVQRSIARACRQTLQTESEPAVSAPKNPGSRRRLESQRETQRALQRELRQGLMQPVAQISPKFFYDERGCALFEQITRLPEYYPTRTEDAIMARYEQAMVEAMAPCQVLIELGAGNCEKVRRLCRSLAPRQFVGVDIAADFLARSVQRLEQDFAPMAARAVAADFTQDWALPADVPRAGRLLFYPGSSIGNFDPDQAQRMLARMRGLLGDDGALLIGIDLPKPREVLIAAYDDAQGVTAAFNSNALQHVNSVLGSDFDLQDWAHEARFDTSCSRVEMHLRALRPVIVGWPQGLRQFAEGETIHTENSYKYPLGEFLGMLSRAGFDRKRVWTDAQNWYAVIHAHA